MNDAEENSTTESENTGDGGYYTLMGYQMNRTRGASENPDGKSTLTYAMEDYLEMICRISERGGELRVRDIARELHVKPSSVTKMLQNLCHAGYIRTERYGFIYITDAGHDAGAYLLHRHAVITRFLRLLNKSGDETETAEKIEHYLDSATVYNLEKLTVWLTGMQDKQ